MIWLGEYDCSMSMSSYDLGIPGSCLKLRCEVACRLRCGLACMILTEGFTFFGFKVFGFELGYGFGSRIPVQCQEQVG